MLFHVSITPVIPKSILNLQSLLIIYVWYILKWQTSTHKFCYFLFAFLHTNSLLKKKESAPMGSKSFFVNADNFQEGEFCRLPLRVYSFPLTGFVYFLKKSCKEDDKIICGNSGCLRGVDTPDRFSAILYKATTFMTMFAFLHTRSILKSFYSKGKKIFLYRIRTFLEVKQNSSDNVSSLESIYPPRQISENQVWYNSL